MCVRPVATVHSPKALGSVCLCVLGLWLTDDLTRENPTSHPVTAATGSSASATLKRTGHSDLMNLATPSPPVIAAVKFT